MLQNQMSNFSGPNAFPYGVTINNLPILNTFPGVIYWVDSTFGSDGNEGTFNAAFGTVAYALTKVVANRGDAIMVKQGHVETISVAGGWACSVAGVNIIGVGEGSGRPQITFSAAASSILVTAASVNIQNIIGIAGAVCTNPFNIQAADCTLNIEWRDVTATTAEAARVVLTNASASRLVCWLKHIGLTTSTACVNSIRLVGGANQKIYVDFSGVASTAVVEFLTTAVVDAEIAGLFNNVGTALTKNIVDTVTGSTWAATNCFDVVGGYQFAGGSGSALASTSAAVDLAVPAPNATTNLVERDVIGNKSDTAVATVGTTASIIAYVKGILNSILVGTTDAATNVFSRDVVGNKSDAAVTTVGVVASITAYIKGILNQMAVPTTDSAANLLERDAVGSKADTAVAVASATASLTAYAKSLVSNSERFAISATAVMVNGNTIFTVSGDIEILSLISECITNNDATASTIQYQSAPTVGAAATFSGASASLANALAGASLALIGTTLATAPNLVASGANLGMQNAGMFIPAGTIKLVVAVGSTVGTWRHYMRYRALEVGATVS